MSAPELPRIEAALWLLLMAAPFVALALRRADRVLPRRLAPAQVWSAREVLAIVVAPFVVLFALSALLARPESHAEPRAAGESVLLGLVGTQLVLGSGAALAAAFAARRPEGLASLGLALPVPRGAFVSVVLVFLPGLVCFLALGIAWTHVCRAVGWEERQEILRMILSLDVHELWLAGAVAVLVGPLIEELVFRAFLQTLVSRFAGQTGGLVLISLLFARMHGMAGLPVLLALSLFLGWLWQRTRCIWVSWFAHALNNAVTLGLALAFAPE